MENASKAIVIAGGILIGIITISIFYYMFNRISSFTDATSKNYEQEELLDFNQGFEYYNKKLMYGADVISVINKAIDNNRRNGVKAGDTSGFSVNIIITLNSDLQARVEYYTMYSVKEKEENLLGSSLKKDTSYSLKDNKERIESAIINALSGVDDDGNTYNNANSVIRENLPSGGYKLIYYPAAEFKRKMFYCSEVKYDSKTGRISEMQFHEKSSS